MDFVKDREDRSTFDPDLKLPLRLFRGILDKGVIARAAGVSGIAMCPPYVVEPAEIDTIIGTIHETVDEVISEVS